jgi:CRP-like cAMP-binding protein
MLRSIESAGLLVHYFERHERLTVSQEYWWKIEEGAVRAISWREDGTVFALGLWGPGDVVGGPLCQVSPLEIECLTLVRAVQVPRSHWTRTVEDLVRHIQRSGEFLQIVQGGDVTCSLQQMLAWLAQRFGQPHPGGLLIDLPLTHRDLAELVGSTRVTVTRLLKELEQQGVIYRVGRQMVLCTHAQAVWRSHAV